MNKKGDFTGSIYLVVSIAALAIVLLIGGYIADKVGVELKDKISSENVEVNRSFDATINVANNTLPAVWYIVFVLLLIGLFITAWYMPTHPLFVAPFIILLIVTVILGVAFSDMYEELYGYSTFSDMAENQTSIHFIMSNLPIVALVIGILALIITFAKPGGNSAPIA